MFISFLGKFCIELHLYKHIKADLIQILYISHSTPTFQMHLIINKHHIYYIYAIYMPASPRWKGKMIGSQLLPDETNIYAWNKYDHHKSFQPHPGESPMLNFKVWTKSPGYEVATDMVKRVIHTRCPRKNFLLGFWVIYWLFDFSGSFSPT